MHTALGMDLACVSILVANFNCVLPSPLERSPTPVTSFLTQTLTEALLCGARHVVCSPPAVSQGQRGCHFAMQPPAQSTHGRARPTDGTLWARDPGTHWLPTPGEGSGVCDSLQDTDLYCLQAVPGLAGVGM